MEERLVLRGLHPTGLWALRFIATRTRKSRPLILALTLVDQGSGLGHGGEGRL